MKKKLTLLIYPLVLFGFVIVFSNSCKKEDTTNSTVTDIDGNIYHTVNIGTQVWMVENLKTVSYRNGDPISNVTDTTEWVNLTAGAFCYYNNDKNNSISYGILYNYYAVIDGRNIAPPGWHIPSDSEWTILITYLGGQQVAGGYLKENGTLHWQAPNYVATNQTAFNALPGGFRSNYRGIFFNLGTQGNWWSSTLNYSDRAWSFNMPNTSKFTWEMNSSMLNGYSVHCVKD